VLEREAANADMDVTQLKALSPGRQRRVVHDDITGVLDWAGEVIGHDELTRPVAGAAPCSGGRVSW